MRQRAVDKPSTQIYNPIQIEYTSIYYPARQRVVDKIRQHKRYNSIRIEYTWYINAIYYAIHKNKTHQ